MVLIVIPNIIVVGGMVMITRYAIAEACILCFAQKLLLGVSGTLLLEDIHMTKKYN